MYQNPAFIIPAFNEGQRLSLSLTNLCSILKKENGSYTLVVVDDGSVVPVEVQSELLKSENIKIHLLRHPINLGQGAALQTGIQYALDRLNCDAFLTFDGDGQHSPPDAVKMLKELGRGEVDIVFGNRFAVSEIDIPASRRILLRLAAAFERIVTGLKLTDAHNGLRAFNSAVANKIRLKQNGMAHATEIKQIVRANNFRYAEVPTRILYTEEHLKKGQRNTNSLNILKDMLRNYFFRI